MPITITTKYMLNTPNTNKNKKKAQNHHINSHNKINN